MERKCHLCDTRSYTFHTTIGQGGLEPAHGARMCEQHVQCIPVQRYSGSLTRKTKRNRNSFAGRVSQERDRGFFRGSGGDARRRCRAGGGFRSGGGGGARSSTCRYLGWTAEGLGLDQAILPCESLFSLPCLCARNHQRRNARVRRGSWGVGYRSCIALLTDSGTEDGFLVS